MSARVHDVDLLAFFRRLHELRRWEWTNYPAPAPVPTLVIQGADEVAATPAEIVAAFEAICGRPVGVVRGRHMPYLSYPEDFNRVVRAFLLRAPSLPPAVRARLAAQVGETIAQRVQPPPPAGVPAEVFLASVAAAYRNRGA